MDVLRERGVVEGLLRKEGMDRANKTGGSPTPAQRNWPPRPKQDNITREIEEVALQRAGITREGWCDQREGAGEGPKIGRRQRGGA